LHNNKQFIIRRTDGLIPVGFFVARTSPVTRVIMAQVKLTR